MQVRTAESLFVSPVKRLSLLAQVVDLHKLVSTVSECYVNDVINTNHVNLDFLRVVHKLHENNLELIKCTNFLISIGMGNDKTLKPIAADLEMLQKRIIFIYKLIDEEKEITDQGVCVSHTGFVNTVDLKDQQGVVNHKGIGELITNLSDWCPLNLTMSTELSETLRNTLDSIDHFLEFGGMGSNQSSLYSTLDALKLRREILFIKTVLWK